ncbi:GDSL esterase/lipase [Heracleum sosnowskyi]|uniref:GDSL esterase/lipase n=1 Tax=Heracleum sosnowskyi TaxID=360622 RepID=A0AAD8HK21_9APIA|nr:GDSL esterase/lipase [Heracleum sosnowskyi]
MCLPNPNWLFGSLTWRLIQIGKALNIQLAAGSIRYWNPMNKLILLSLAQMQIPNRINNSINLAFFMFGDSTVDPGNNNNFQTILKGNFPPYQYGNDFVNQTPTGRLTNGRLVTDYAVSYAGVKDYVPPYSDPKLSTEELLTGVSFASAGSGFDPLTPKLNGAVVSMPKQMEYFREYKSRVEAQIGKERTEVLIKNVVYIISAGTNDYVFNYFGVSRVRRFSYSIVRYYQFLVQQIQQFIQDLLDFGAEKIVMVGLPPIGCLPVVITLNSGHIDRFLKRQCIPRLSEVAQGFNVVDTGCCGTGLLELSCLCNPRSSLCPNVSEYMFFDSVHPTERIYYLLFKALSPTIDLILQGK